MLISNLPEDPLGLVAKVLPEAGFLGLSFLLLGDMNSGQILNRLGLLHHHLLLCFFGLLLHGIIKSVVRLLNVILSEDRLGLLDVLESKKNQLIVPADDSQSFLPEA